MRRVTLVSMVLAIVLVAHQALAHHNMTALFDFNDRVTLNGTLTKIDWRNPRYVPDARRAGSPRRS